MKSYLRKEDARQVKKGLLGVWQRERDDFQISALRLINLPYKHVFHSLLSNYLRILAYIKPLRLVCGDRQYDLYLSRYASRVNLASQLLCYISLNKAKHYNRTKFVTYVLKIYGHVCDSRISFHADVAAMFTCSTLADVVPQTSLPSSSRVSKTTVNFQKPLSWFLLGPLRKKRLLSFCYSWGSGGGLEEWHFDEKVFES